MRIEGTCDDRFHAVREAFEANFVERGDTVYDEGASVAVTLEGERALPSRSVSAGVRRL